MKFEFATATRIVFGAGAISQLGANVKNLGRRALVVTGRDPGRAGKLLGNLTAAGISSAAFSVSGEPEIGTVERGSAFAENEQCDFVIGFGGGSVLDAAKAIAAMLANKGALLDYLEIIGQGRALAKRPSPFVAIPTTAGTGSEVTRNAVLASPEHKVKVSLRSPLMLAQLAVIDPELTYDLPPALTASTGLDALTQLIEPYTCLRANPMTDSHCEDGIQRVARSLGPAVDNGLNQSAREDMAMASLFGGLALANAGLGAVHGFAGPIGGAFTAPHGAVCAALLPHAMAANIKAMHERSPKNFALGRYCRIAILLTGHQHATADAGVEWVSRFIADLPILRLRDYGIREEHFPDLISKAANASSMKANPIQLTPAELTEILRRAT
jgi:alcohol dehydrogenase class IV